MTMMSRVRARRCCWSIALAALLALPAVASAQSLVQAARAAEEQRDELGESRRAFTNDSLSVDAPPAVPLRRPSAAEAAEALAAASVDEPDAEDTEGEPGDGDTAQAAADDQDSARGEDYWRDRLSDVRAEMGRNETLRAALQTRVNALTADFTAVDDPAQRQVIFDERQTALGELASMQDTIEANRQAIADIQDEGRRAGVPAGWRR
jgi:hypothetical protein